MKIKLIYLLATIFILSTCFQSCKKDDDTKNTNEMYDPDDDVVRPTLVVSINGDISVENFETGTVGTVTFSRFPVTVNEWKKVQEQIGETMMGAVALQVMAGELYRRKTNVGTECMKLNTLSSHINNYSGLLKDVLRTRPYQFAAFLNGASWDNGYNPTKPYTIEFHVTNTSYKEHSDTFQADLYKFFIKSNGHEINEGLQPVVVVRTAKPGEPGEGGKYYIIHESSSIYLQCKEKSFTADFNGLD